MKSKLGCAQSVWSIREVVHIHRFSNVNLKCTKIMLVGAQLTWAVCFLLFSSLSVCLPLSASANVLCRTCCCCCFFIGECRTSFWFFALFHFFSLPLFPSHPLSIQLPADIFSVDHFGQPYFRSTWGTTVWRLLMLLMLLLPPKFCVCAQCAPHTHLHIEDSVNCCCHVTHSSTHPLTDSFLKGNYQLASPAARPAALRQCTFN